jgi:hypothetical protein
METITAILDGFFTKEEQDNMRNLVETNRNLEYNSSRFAPMVIESMSRMQIEFILPKDIEEKLVNLAKQYYNDPDLVLSHYQYLDYYGKYGKGQSPMLPPHLDTENYYTKISVDYQMNSNIDWAVVIEGEKFILKNSQVLVFEAGERIHWRDPIKLKEDDRCEVIVFHFSNKNDHQPYVEKQMDKDERQKIIDYHNNLPRMKEYREQFFNQVKQLESDK